MPPHASPIGQSHNISTTAVQQQANSQDLPQEYFSPLSLELFVKCLQQKAQPSSALNGDRTGESRTENHCCKTLTHLVCDFSCDTRSEGDFVSSSGIASSRRSSGVSQIQATFLESLGQRAVVRHSEHNERCNDDESERHWQRRAEKKVVTLPPGDNHPHCFLLFLSLLSSLGPKWVRGQEVRRSIVRDWGPFCLQAAARFLPLRSRGLRCVKLSFFYSPSLLQLS